MIRVQADADQKAAHHASDKARELVVAAKDAARDPGPAPRTSASVWLLGTLLLQFECKLSDSEMDAVRGYVLDLARRCGAADIIAGRARQELLEEQTRARQHGLNTPRPVRSYQPLPVESAL
jgi:hypothetical protein